MPPMPRPTMTAGIVSMPSKVRWPQGRPGVLPGAAGSCPVLRGRHRLGARVPAWASPGENIPPPGLCERSPGCGQCVSRCTTRARTPRPRVSLSARMIVDAGQQLAFAPVGQVDPADEIELPQRHRGFPLPPLVLALVPLDLRDHHAVALQAPVDRRPRRGTIDPALGGLERDPAGTPPGVGPAQFAHQRLGRPAAATARSAAAATRRAARRSRPPHTGPATSRPTASRRRTGPPPR